MLSLLNEEVEAFNDFAEKLLRGKGDLVVNDSPETLQHSVQLLSSLGMSMLLRTAEMRSMQFAVEKRSDGTASELLEFYPDIYARELICAHAAPAVLRHLPIPQGKPADTWYKGTGFFVHREQPPVPSSGALKHDNTIFEQEGFYDTYATLTCYPTMPVPLSEESTGIIIVPRL